MKKIFLFLAFAFPLLAQMNILVFAGSTRADSYNKKLAAEAAQIARNLGGHVTLIDLKDYPMPFYDADLEKKGMPKNAKRFRDLMIANEAVVIASPEYNASISGVLKNAIDWASRGENGGASREAFERKQFALMSASPGKMGGARGLVHLRAIIEAIGGEVLPIQVTVPNASSAFTAENLPALKERIQEELEPLFQE